MCTRILCQLEAAIEGLAHAMQDTTPSGKTLSQRRKEGRCSATRLVRVSCTDDLLQLRRSSAKKSLAHQVLCVCTRVLCQLEAVVEGLAPGDGGTGSTTPRYLTLRDLALLGTDALSEDSCALSVSSEDTTHSERCLMLVEMVPRALVLPFALQAQLLRCAVHKVLAEVDAMRLLRRARNVLSRVVGRRRLIVAHSWLSRIPVVRRVANVLLDEQQDESSTGSARGIVDDRSSATMEDASAEAEEDSALQRVSFFKPS